MVPIEIKSSWAAVPRSIFCRYAPPSAGCGGSAGPGRGQPRPAAAQLRKGRTFLIRGQRPREGPTFQMQCQVQNMSRRRAQKQTQNAQHTHHLAPMYAGLRAFMLRQRAARYCAASTSKYDPRHAVCRKNQTPCRVYRGRAFHFGQNLFCGVGRVSGAGVGAVDGLQLSKGRLHLGSDLHMGQKVFTPAGRRTPPACRWRRKVLAGS